MTAVRIFASPGVYPKRELEVILASRDWIRTLAVLGAITVDLALLAMASLISAYLRFGFIPAGEGGVFLLMMLPAFALACVTFDTYRLETLKRPLMSAWRSNCALLVAAGFAFTAAFALQLGSRFSRLEIGYLLVFGAVFLTIGRLVGARGLSVLRPAIEPSIFVLGDETAVRYAKDVTRVINVRASKWRASDQDPDFLDLVCRTLRNADRVLLVFADPRERSAWARFMRLTGYNAELVEPQLTNFSPLGVGRWAGAPTLVVARGPLSLPERVIKRALDVACVIVLAPVVAPLVALLAILVRIESRGPSFFIQERVGRNNRHYRCYKLRTMRTDACDPVGTRSTARNDFRITALGRFLRRTSLDELPQLWNVVVGDMSMVGPRPHALGSTAEGALFWEAVSGYWTRHSVKPGLTGLAQIRGLRGATHSRRDLEDRLAADLEYVNSWSIWLDLKILLKTPFGMLHRNAY
jgi:exopolysaccharide biosynthesis polyprenyl glycosylphosphotransferase